MPKDLESTCFLKGIHIIAGTFYEAEPFTTGDVICKIGEVDYVKYKYIRETLYKHGA